jgi:hypothetical protein
VYTRSDIHLLSRRGILVPLYHLMAAHTQVQMRRRGGIPGCSHNNQYGAGLPSVYAANVRCVQTAITMATKIGDGSRISLGLCVSILCIGFVVAIR